MTSTGLRKRGALIVFEGIDRSGKSTQARRLVKSLNDSGHEAELMAFPDRQTPTGRLIDEHLGKNADECDQGDRIVNDEIIQLLFAANRREKRRRIANAIESGKTIVMDRYIHSGFAYATANHLDPKWCRAIEGGMPCPDHVFLMDIDPEAAARRGTPIDRKERYDDCQFQSRVRNHLLGYMSSSWELIDAGMPEAEIAKRILARIPAIDVECGETKLRRFKGGPRGFRDTVYDALFKPRPVPSLAEDGD